ncbi:hypothetical protein [Terrilactibacillus laevilacticus]|uniref:Uncharacterized protein n=1 Tax=Terrilactibacillus laevilacticus TaxID=1380157 RepID=A0ABW5PQU8_9BACI|nr:hypothetical protein [Terrilactibacillus laevilacticus]
MFFFIILGGVAILLSGAFLGSGLDGDAFRANFFLKQKSTGIFVQKWLFGQEA